MSFSTHYIKSKCDQLVTIDVNFDYLVKVVFVLNYFYLAIDK